MVELEFYDVKTKSKFKTTEFRVESRESKGVTRHFAVAKSPAPGATHECWKVLSKVQAAELMK